MGNFVRDVKFGLRMLAKSPGFTAVAIITLALGIGTNTAIFSFVNALLFRQPGIQAPGQLLELWQKNTKASGLERYLPLSYPQYTYYRDSNQVFSSLLAFDGEMHTLAWSRSAEGGLLQGQLVSGSFFLTLGVKPVLGRTFLPGEDRVPISHPVIVLSHAFWEQRLGSDSAILGKTLTLNGMDFTVIGVAPAGFTGIIIGNQPDFWAPLSATPLFTHDPNFLASWDSLWLFGIGRLKPGISRDQAQAGLSIVAHNLQQDQPKSNKGIEAATFPVNLVPSPFRGYVAAFTGLLMAVVGMVLLIACANVANLLLAKAVARRHEIAVRSALGASRAHLVRQALTESLILSCLGGAVALILAFWAVPLLASLKPPSLPVRFDVPVDWHVFLFTFLLAIGTGVLFGLVPALRSSKPGLGPALRDEAHGSECHRSRLRSALIAAQVSVCLILLIGAALCVRSLINAQSIDPGFDTQNILTAGLDPGSLGYSPEKIRAFYPQVVERVESLPGVASASLIGYLPLGTARQTLGVTIAGIQPPAGLSGYPISMTSVGPKFCQTMGVPLLEGRDFVAGDANASPQPVIINEAMKRRFWPGKEAIGRNMEFTGDKNHRGMVVIGVVKTGKYHTLSESPQPFMYLPLDDRSKVTLVVRTKADPKALLPEVRRTIQTLDPNVVPVDLETMKQYMELPLFPAHTTGLLLGAFGLIALVLAVTGLYGVISYAVSQRTHEIGVRMALGAQQRDVLRLVVSQGMLWTLVGVAIGLAGSWALTRFLSSLLYGIRATDPATFVGISLLLCLVALLASYIPARRAANVDPMVALRHE